MNKENLDFFVFEQERIKDEIKELASHLSLAEVLAKTANTFTVIIKCNNCLIKITCNELSLQIIKKYFHVVFIREAEVELMKLDI